MSFELDDDTELEPFGDGRYGTTVTDRWMVGIGPNGGYLAAVCLRAVLSESTLPDPVTMTIHYLSRPLTGAADIAVTTLRVGRGHATYRVELAQDGELRCAGLVTCGRLRAAGPLDFQPTAPDVPSPDASIAVRRIGESPTLWDRLETKSATREDLFYFKAEAGEAATGGWTRLADGRPTDALAIAVFLDCWPPAIFNRTMRPDPAGAPTIEYTVHWRNRPTSDWCYAWFETTTFAGGYVDEDGVLFDENGVLVAESRQLARYSGVPPS